MKLSVSCQDRAQKYEGLRNFDQNFTGKRLTCSFLALLSTLSEAECSTPVDTEGFDVVKLNKTFCWVGIPYS
jgi:hypothetical protein